MRSVYLTDKQFRHLLNILETAKHDAVNWMHAYATSEREKQMVDDYCRGVDAVIDLLEQAVTNNLPSIQEKRDGR